MLQIINKHKLLLLVLAVAAILRLWGLGTNPPHLTNDEAALGYNAYSILITAKDEHGEFMPIVFKSFGDWKPGLYIYLTVPWVAIFGLNEFSTRIVGALSGVIAVFLIYLITRKIYPQNSWVALLSAFFFSTSPWHLQFSRGAWESGLSLTLVLAGTYFFLRSVFESEKWLTLSAFFFALTLWAYQGAKLSTLVVLVGLALAYRNQVWKISKKTLILSFLIGVIVSTPIIISVLQGRGSRLEIYNVFSYPRPEVYVNNILTQGGEDRNSWQYIAYHSEGLNFARGILGRWLNHFSGKFLFFTGDWTSFRHSTPYTGELLLVTFVFLIFGIVTLARRGLTRETVLLLFWLAVSPVPAAFSRDQVHAVRSFFMLVPLSIILSLGAVYLWEATHKRSRLLITSLFSLLFAVNFAYYLDQYWIHAPIDNAQSWNYGYKQMVEKVTPLQSVYPEIVIERSYDQPYIFFLFYQKYDPVKYQASASEVYEPSSVGDVGLITKLDNITFREPNWSADRGMRGKLFVYDTAKVPVVDSNDAREFNLIDRIDYPNGQIAFRLIEVK